ncbi:MAG: M20/M25/M40 family metallo-hydrolase [Bacillota bacterium]
MSEEWSPRIADLAERSDVKRMREHVREKLGWVVEEIVNICEIPSPSYEEKKRAEYVAEKFRELGLDEVTVDSHNNAVGRYRGEDGTIRMAVTAHIDTVFPIDTDVTVERGEDRLAAPGIGDNSTSVAVMLGVISAWKATDYRPPFDVIFSGNACEEGLGDLRGMKGLLDSIEKRQDAELAGVVALDGKIGAITNAGIGSRRLKVDVSARGGHSWGDFPSPSAIHAIGACIEGIARLDVPEKPRTSFNVGTVEGGTSVNTIAEQASMLIDMRSEALEPLGEVEEKVRKIIDERCEEFEADYEIEVVGDRPVGSVPDDHPLVEIAREAGGRFDMDMPTRASSTDANVPLSRGIPAITLGVYQGEGAHRKSEWMTPSSLEEGLPLAVLVTVGAVDWIGQTR